MSTIKVDTYQTRGGASEIAIDKLKGVTAAGSMLVVGEGGTNTTNLQQGLVKAWCVTTSQATVGNTFNVSGGTDNGTGDYSYALSSALANANIAATGNPLSSGDRNTAVHTSTTTSYKISIFNQDGSRVDVTNATIVCGDLA